MRLYEAEDFLPKPGKISLEELFKIAQAGGEPGIFWFSHILTHKQHLWCLGYCATISKEVKEFLSLLTTIGMYYKSRYDRNLLC